MPAIIVFLRKSLLFGLLMVERFKPGRIEVNVLELIDQTI
jgi:hypothetical protein